MRALSLLQELLRELVDRPLQPGPIYVFQREEVMANRFRTLVFLPPVVDTDTVKMELSCLVNGVAEPVRPFEKPFASETEYIFPQDATVNLSLVNVDDAGNRSSPSERQFVVTDTVPPAAPGELGVQIVEEV